MKIVDFQLEISATDRILAQRNNLECGVSEFDCGNSIIRRPMPTRSAEPGKKNNTKVCFEIIFKLFDVL